MTAMPTVMPSARLDYTRRPMLVFWESTRACQLACRHCRASATAHALPGELTTAEGHVFFINDFGILRTVQPDKTYKLLAESELKEKVFASPALGEGQIFIRTDKSLICLGKRTTKTAAR